jgi:hypothetical protein
MLGLIGYITSSFPTNVLKVSGVSHIALVQTKKKKTWVCTYRFELHYIDGFVYFEEEFKEDFQRYTKEVPYGLMWQYIWGNIN